MPNHLCSLSGGALRDRPAKVTEPLPGFHIFAREHLTISTPSAHPSRAASYERSARSRTMKQLCLIDCENGVNATSASTDRLLCPKLLTRPIGDLDAFVKAATLDAFASRERGHWKSQQVQGGPHPAEVRVSHLSPALSACVDATTICGREQRDGCEPEIKGLIASD